MGMLCRYFHIIATMFGRIIILLQFFVAVLHSYFVKMDGFHANEVSLGVVSMLWHGVIMTNPTAITSAIETRWPAAWAAILDDIGVRVALANLADFLRGRAASGAVIYPPKDQRLRALHTLAPNEVKVVILGQDPYHGPGQAEGLSFSVPVGERVPPSLRNIYKELAADVGCRPPSHGHLAHWAKQGVLLLNAVLTVEQGQANAHQGRGWEIVTDAVIRHLARHEKPVVFLLWGAYAQKKAALIAAEDGMGRHCILRAAHPSPLSAHKGFWGCRHFSKANAFLAEHGLTPIDWQLPENGG